MRAGAHQSCLLGVVCLDPHGARLLSPKLIAHASPACLTVDVQDDAGRVPACEAGGCACSGRPQEGLHARAVMPRKRVQRGGAVGAWAWALAGDHAAAA